MRWCLLGSLILSSEGEPRNNYDFLGGSLLRSYRTVGSYSLDIVQPYCCQSFLELVPSTFVSRCLLTPDCVSPNVKLLIQYVNGVLSAEVSLSCYRRRARQSPMAMAPSPRNGSGQPAWGDVY